MAKMRVSVDLGHVHGQKSVEIEVDDGEYLKPDGSVDHRALEKDGQEVLFTKVITWDVELVRTPTGQSSAK